MLVRVAHIFCVTILIRVVMVFKTSACLHENEEYSLCGWKCPPTCVNLRLLSKTERLCPLRWECMIGCRCSAGYIRDEYSKNCVYIHNCPVTLHSSLASDNQYLDNPGTVVIEAVPADNAISSNERGDQDVAEDSSEACSESEDFMVNPTVDNQLPPEFTSMNHLNTPNPDPYLRATFHKGHYYPYSAYNAYNNMYNSPNDAGRGKGSSYNDIWYPYTDPNAYVAVNYIPPVKSLPPVYARFYGNSFPIEQEWYPSQIPRQKRLHEYDDLIKQLEYESIMKNILPTMSIPLPRDGSIQQSERVPYLHGTFPYGTSDCAIPILLGCTPKITYGNEGNQNLFPIPYTDAYRNLLESTEVHDHVDINDDKVVKTH